MSNTLKTTDLMTAKQFQVAESLPAYCELVKGKVVEMNRPSPRHGQICASIAYLLLQHCKQHDWGAVYGNDSGIQTLTDPDTVRGADVACCSFNRIPKGKLPDDYSGPSPEVVFEVLSKSDRWASLLIKIGEYLQADVQVVCVVDPTQQTVRSFRQDGSDVMQTEDETLSVPEIKPTFRCKVADLFS